MIILGAGMAGCLVGAINNDAIIYEAQNEIPDNHNAVLRFREDKISKTTGIPFRKVKVTKTIWHDGREVQPSPRFSNWYSKKVTGKISERSIDNINPVERFIAPPDFHLILADICRNRIKFGYKVSEIRTDGMMFHNIEGAFDRSFTPIISTIPMHILSAVTRIPITADFNFKNIFITRYKIKNSDVFQTIYYPDPQFKIYRATITGEDLIVESMGNNLDGIEEAMLIESLGLKSNDLQFVAQKEQKYGKINPINDNVRKRFMFEATHQLAIYSLGRFACWRNILLDDVYDDIFKIKRMTQSDIYNIKLEMSNEG